MQVPKTHLMIISGCCLLERESMNNTCTIIVQ